MQANQDVIIGVRVQLEQAKKQLRAVSKSVRTSMTDVAKSQQLVYTRTQELNKALGKTQFQGWALSIMFFGMALKQMFNTVWQFGTKTFNDIMHSVEGTVTGFDILNNSLTYLGFVVGQALEPVAEFLAPVIDKISEWILNNEELFATLVIVAGILGTIFTVIGMLVLSVSGLAQGWGIVTSAMSSGAVATALNGIAAAFWPITAAVLALIVLWTTNFAGFKDFIIGTFTIVWEFLKGIWNNIAGIFRGFFNVIKGIFTGDFELIWNGAKDIVLNVLALLTKAFFAVGAVLLNVFIFAWNAIISLTINNITIMLGLFKKLADALGMDWISKKIKSAIDTYTGVKNKLTVDYFTGEDIAPLISGTDALLGTGTTTTNNTTVNNYITAQTVDQALIDRINQEIGARTP